MFLQAGTAMVSLIVNGRPYESSAANMLDLLYEAEGYLDEGHAISRILVDGAEARFDPSLLERDPRSAGGGD